MNEPREIFVSSLRSAQDLAGFFEFSDETGWFYLYNQHLEEGKRVLAAIHIVSRWPVFAESELEVRWNKSETKVGLFIKNQLWAVFDEKGNSWGGNYHVGTRSPISQQFVLEF